jgi:small redox-active disulfide protein 2
VFLRITNIDKNNRKMDIKVLGTGCAKCKTLEKVVKEVVAENEIDAIVSKVEDIVEIMQFGVMSTPALVVDGEVVLSGKVPNAQEVKELLVK